jgi:hypothetical protein
MLNKYITFCYRSLIKGNVVYIIFFIKVKASNELSIAAHFFKKQKRIRRIFCIVFETVCASSLAMCAYQIREHLHLTFADHLHLYSQQANPNFRFRSEQIKTHIPFQTQYKIFYESASAFTNGEETTDSIISNMLSNLSCLVFDRSSVMTKIKYGQMTMKKWAAIDSSLEALTFIKKIIYTTFPFIKLL